MSDFDRNITTARTGYRPEVAIDAGLRAYMIRVYNYMTAGVALTGLVSPGSPFPLPSTRREPVSNSRLSGIRCSRAR